MVVDPIEQAANVAFVPLIFETSRLDDIHGSSRIPEPLS